MTVARVATTSSVDAVELAAVAARTFPLACPPSVALPDIAAFIDANLSDARFTDYLADPQRLIFTTSDGGSITGYAMLISGVSDDPDVQRAVDIRPAVELSKMYVLPAHHGSGAAAALMNAALTAAAERGDGCVWLGVNQKNARAQRFYAKSGFTVSGHRSFRLGDHLENDYVMVRPFTR
ncbi:GNAT family N-acetyltransferase [Mycobacterium paraterrae]|uniref:GNAT family N-acetyltransferase n=1 Tax=Mycobacterium paraterrae TaxID=577492 RepID=A0ABY3VH38_9MYCO|nr:GNAT family N-acetyltransferase [Mycobacterium paraterrae]UMB67792.1 GNAT family N-acetyltransferase [Mycobacterium paraterrae]